MNPDNSLADQDNQQAKNSKPGGIIYWLAVGFGSGLAPKAPGTAGTVVAIPIFLLMNYLVLWQYLVVVLILFLVGIWICESAANRLGVHDDPSIVWDEIVGYLITMIAAPPGWLWVVTGFVLFRLFDILKPWPIRVIDKRVKGGMGIMLDDVLAALFALILMQVGQTVLLGQ